MLLVAIEYIVSIVVLVEECERHRRLSFLKYVNGRCVDVVVSEKITDVFAHSVIARLADEHGLDARPSERYDAVKGGASRHSLDGLAVLEDDVEHCLADTYYFSLGGIYWLLI